MRARKSNQDSQLQALFRIQEGVYILVKANEIGDLTSCCKMGAFIIKTINECTTDKVKDEQIRKTVINSLQGLLIQTKEMVANNSSTWMSHINKQQQFQIQLFMRLCLLKLLQFSINTNCIKENEIEIEKYKEEIIVIINQLKIQHIQFDIYESLKQMISYLSCIDCLSFDEFLKQLTDYFDLKPFDSVQKLQLNIKHKITTSKQRSNLIKDIVNISANLKFQDKIQGKITTSTNTHQGKNFSHSYAKPKLILDRTIFLSHPFKYTFKRKQYGYE